MKSVDSGNSDLNEEKDKNDPFNHEEKGSIKDRIKALLKDRTTRQAAKDWDIPHSTLGTYLSRGTIPPLDKAYNIASKEGVTLEWLVTGDNEDKKKHTEADIVHLEKFAVLASAGGGSYIEDERVESIYPFSHEFLKHHRLSHAINDLCIIEAKGDSMEPMIFNGYDLLVNRQEIPDYKPLAGTYVITIDGALKVKTLEFDLARDGYSIISENKAYADEFIPRKELNRMKVIGEVALILGKPIK